jgi:ribosome-associated protein
VRRKQATVIDPHEKALLAREYLDAKKAFEPVILDLRGITPISDYFVICSGSSNTHIRGLADFVNTEFEKKGVRCNRVEGYQGADWVLMDYGDVVVHIFTEELREFYSLERLWGDAPKIPFVASPPTQSRSTAKEPSDA